MTRPEKHMNIEHIRFPCAGDYWHEMFKPVARVAAVEPRHVVVEKFNPPGIVRMSRQAFRKWLSYDSIEGTWADVVPK
jgi:hypothetical protein